MTNKIMYTYSVKSNFCSDFSLVPKSELGNEVDSKKDIYNINAVGAEDENGKDFLQIRTRYYFSSPNDKDNFLYCFYE